jgi:hypothetical protein
MDDKMTLPYKQTRNPAWRVALAKKVIRTIRQRDWGREKIQGHAMNLPGSQVIRRLNKALYTGSRVLNALGLVPKKPMTYGDWGGLTIRDDRVITYEQAEEILEALEGRMFLVPDEDPFSDPIQVVVVDLITGVRCCIQFRRELEWEVGSGPMRPA